MGAGVAHSTTEAACAYVTTDAGVTHWTMGAGCNYTKTGAVTNTGGADSVGRGAPISTTSTVPLVPHGGQVQCPNSQRSELDFWDLNDFSTICKPWNLDCLLRTCDCGTCTNCTTGAGCTYTTNSWRSFQDLCRDEHLDVRILRAEVL